MNLVLGARCIWALEALGGPGASHNEYEAWGILLEMGFSEYEFPGPKEYEFPEPDEYEFPDPKEYEV